MIIAAAIRTKDGRLFVGKRHGDCITNALNIMLSVNIETLEAKEKLKDCEQGFLDDKGEFLDREKAYYHAAETKQIERRKQTHILISEDLW